MPNRTDITGHLPWFLRAPRAAGLWLVGVLIPIATLAGFILSYRGLYDWASHHSWPYYLAPLFPLLIDLLIIAGEVVLFVAAIDGDTTWWVRGWAWAIVFIFTGLSVIGNMYHASTANAMTRGGWMMPPVVLALALGFGLGILKRQAAKYRTQQQDVTPRVTAWQPEPQRKIMTDEGVSPKTARLVQKRERAAVKAAFNGHGGNGHA